MIFGVIYIQNIQYPQLTGLYSWWLTLVSCYPNLPKKITWISGPSPCRLRLESTINTLPETNIAPENRPGPKRKRSYSNHQFSGAWKFQGGSRVHLFELSPSNLWRQIHAKKKCPRHLGTAWLLHPAPLKQHWYPPSRMVAFFLKKNQDVNMRFFPKTQTENNKCKWWHVSHFYSHNLRLMSYPPGN